MSIINLSYPHHQQNNQCTLWIIIQDALIDLGENILIEDSNNLKISNTWSVVIFKEIKWWIYYLYNLLFWENYNKLSPEIIQRIEEFTYNSKNQESTTYNLIGILESWKKWNL